jgi:hypothetical protein
MVSAPNQSEFTDESPLGKELGNLKSARFV